MCAIHAACSLIRFYLRLLAVPLKRHESRECAAQFLSPPHLSQTISGRKVRGEAMLQKDGRFLDVETVHLKARSNLVIFLMILLLFALNVNGDYIIIDVSGGTDVKSYPVSRLDAPPLGGWPAEYKTDKIVLARIQAGTFVRRKAIAEYPFISTNANDSYSIVVSRPYYIGVFPVTQRQWEHVLGTRPSSFRNDTDYAMRPVESVSYTMVRGDTKGTGYPHSVDVDDNSFIGVLRKKAGLTSLDIPTEDQWECACHAGKTAQ